MKKNTKLILFFLIIFIMFFAGIANGFLKLNFSLSKLHLENPFIVYIFIIINIIFQVNIHEFGHYIMGKLVNYKLILYKVCFFSWQYENGKMKFLLSKKNLFDGLCSMIPTKDFNPKKHMLFISGGIIMNILSVFFLQFISFYSTNQLNKNIILLCNICTIFLIISNSLPISIKNYNTDGKLFFSLLFKSNLGEYLSKITISYTELSCGIRPRNLHLLAINVNDQDSRLLNIQSSLLYLAKSIDCNDLAEANKIVSFIESNLDKLPAIAVPGFYNELIYYYSVIDFNKDKANFYFDKNKNSLLKDKDCNGRRVLASYEYYINKNVDLAKKHCTDGLNVAAKFPIKGQALMEIDLLNNILKNIPIEEKTC